MIVKWFFRVRKRLWMLAAALTCCWVAWYALTPPMGRPVPSEAYVSPLGFAVTAPPGWRFMPKADFSGDFANVLEMSASDGSGSFWFGGVALSRMPLPRIEPGKPALAFNPFVNAALAGTLGTYRIGNLEPDEVDRLWAARVEGVGSWTVMLPGPDAGPEAPVTQDVRFRVYLMRGIDKTFAVAVAGTEKSFRERRQALDDIIASVRIIDRPWGGRHLWELATGKLKAEIWAGFIGLVWGLYKWIFEGMLED